MSLCRNKLSSLALVLGFWGLLPHAGVRGGDSAAVGLVSVSSRLLNAGLSRDVEQNVPIRDQILGFDVFGNGLLVGTISVAPVPCRDAAMLDAVFTGATMAHDISVRSSLRIYTLDTTRIGAHKPLRIDASGVTECPATLCAQTHSQLLTSASDRHGLRGLTVSRLAACQFEKKKAQFEWIGSRHFEQQLAEQIEQESASLLAEANRQFTQQVREPLDQLGLLSSLRFRSAPHDVQALVGSEEALPGTLSAEGDGCSDLYVRLNETLVVGLVEKLLGGKSVTGEDMRQLEEALAKYLDLPPRVSAEETALWSIHFRRRQPLSVAFTEGQIVLTLHADELTSGDRIYPPMDVTARYELIRTERGVRAVRRDELAIYPPDFRPGSRLSARQVAIRAILRRRLARVLPPELSMTQLPLPGVLAQAGPLDVSLLFVGERWFILGWQMPQRGPSATGR